MTIINHKEYINNCGTETPFEYFKMLNIKWHVFEVLKTEFRKKLKSIGGDDANCCMIRIPSNKSYICIITLNEFDKIRLLDKIKKCQKMKVLS